jgi:hypothetical protein
LEYKDKILYYIHKLSLLREEYHETFKILKTKYAYADTDARLAVFTKCAHVMNTAFIGFILIREQLLDPLWWQKHITELDNSTINRHIEDFELYIRSGFILNFFTSIESSFRIYCREVSPGSVNNGAGEFKSVYNHLFSKKMLNLSNHISLLDLWRLIRNTKHNNGVFYPTNQQDDEIEYKGKKYRFEVGKRLSFLTWDFLLGLIPDTRDMLFGVVNSQNLVCINKSIIETWELGTSSSVMDNNLRICMYLLHLGTQRTVSLLFTRYYFLQNLVYP